MATTERYTTVIELNSTQAKKSLEELRGQVEKWKTDLAEAKEKKMGKSVIQELRKELREAQKELRKYDTEVARTVETMGNLEKASVKQIGQAQKALKRMASEVPRDSPFFEQLNSQLAQVTQELENVKATKAFEQLQTEATGAAKSLQLTQAEAAFVKQTVENIDTSSLKQLKMAEQTALRIKEGAKQGTEEYKDAAASLDKIRGRLSDIDARERRVVTIAEQYNQAMRRIGQDTKVVVNETELINRTLSNISTASVRDIEFSIKALKEQLLDIDRSGDKVEKTTQKIKQLNEELKKVQDMQSSGKKKGLISIGADFLNKNWGAITQVIGGYNLVHDIIKGSVDDFAQMDQEMANVRKYTGQTSEEVERMNETFKRMDTRTPREELNRLAGSAGRLGITSTAAVEEFVDAADKINVALGDDLGEGAVDKIGKLAMAFGEDDKKGLRGAMLATGSVVNELAQNSSANAGYLVEFTARLAGVGVQAGLTQAQIMSYGAVMDENMQKDEMASTALSQIITKMTTDSDTFARIAGKNVEEFSKLVRTDMNGALMEFFDAMNKKGGFTELAPLFEQMGLDGTRAIGVLSTLANKIGDVRKHQQLANEAYEEGTSVIEEFNVQNETYQALIDKAKKSFHDLRVELGERLLPVASVALSTTSITARALKTLIDFVVNAKGTIITLTLAIAGLTVAKNLDIIKTKLMVFWNDMLLGSFRKLRIMIMSNPWAAAIVGVSALIGVVADLVSRMKEAALAQKAMADVQVKAAAAENEARRNVEQLQKAVHDYTLTVAERREAGEKLKKTVEGYNVVISDEGRIISENTDALDKYIRKMKEQALVEGARAKITELSQKRADLIYQQAEKQKELADRREAARNRPASTGSQSDVFYNAGVDLKTKSVEKEIGELDKKITEAEDAITLMENVAGQIVKDVEKSATPSSSGKSDFDTRAYWQREIDARRTKLNQLRADAKTTAADVEKAAASLKEAEDKMETFTGSKAAAKAERTMDKTRREHERKANDAAKAETERQLAELTHRYAMGQILYCDYIDEQERIQEEGLKRRMLIYGKESLEYQKLSHNLEEMQLNGSEEQQKLTLQQMKLGHEQRVSVIEETAWRENMTEQQKNEMLFQEDMRFMDEQRMLYRKGTLERVGLENDIENRQQQHRLQTERYYQEQLMQIREQYLNQADDRLRQLEIARLDEIHAQGLLSETEYQEALVAIRAKYANYETKGGHTSRTAGNMLKVAQDEARKKLDDGNTPASNLPVLGDIKMYQTTMEKLKELYAGDEQNHEAYLAAKRQATGLFCQDLAQQMQAAYQSVNQIMSAASSYFSAQQQYETAQVQAKYEKQIEAAAGNQAKVKKLQEKQKKEEAAIKNKYNKKAMAIEIAQAAASTAFNAIAAFGAVLQKGQPWTVPLAYAAAAAATAAGMLQIAAIKKQHAAEQAGYYGGGFTGGKQYRREAGVVHEGEFVANHQAVNNPAIMPFLSFLDRAQRNNTVGSLTAQDVSRSFAPQQAPQVVAPVVNVQTDNSAISDTMGSVADTVDRLNQTIENGIPAVICLDGNDGLMHRIKQYNRLQANK